MLSGQALQTERPQSLQPVPCGTGTPVSAEGQDPDQRQPHTGFCLAFPADSAAQKRRKPCLQQTKNLRPHSAPVAEWGRSAPRNARHPAITAQPGGSSPAGAARLIAHQNERHMSVKVPRRASLQRQDTARTARTAHHPNPQVRQPLRWVRGSPRTPHDASSRNMWNRNVCKESQVSDPREEIGAN